MYLYRITKLVVAGYGPRVQGTTIAATSRRTATARETDAETISDCRTMSGRYAGDSLSAAHRKP